MDRPSFRVVTMVTCVLVCVGGLVTILRPYLPKEVHGHIKSTSEEFLLAGTTEFVDWYPNTQDPFLESRHTGKPIFMLIGTPWSRHSRILGGGAFIDDNAVNVLNEDFVCVRIDGMHHPDLLNELMPLQRLSIPFSTGCQMWVIDPQGEPIQLIGYDPQADDTDAKVETRFKGKFETANVTSMLKDAIKRDSRVESGAGPQPTDSLQFRDLQELRESTTFFSPYYFDFTNALQKAIDPKNGGFPTLDGQTLLPGAWRYQLLTGDDDGLMKSLLPILQSPLQDAVDGGFYRTSTSLDGRSVGFDKLTNQNAEMMLLLAQIGRLRNLPGFTAAAQLTWSYLTNHAFQQNPGFRDRIFATCRVGDESADGRSGHSSYSPRKLRAILNADDRAWARANLGLVVSSNQYMTPFPVSLDVFTKDPATYSRIVAALKASGPPPEKFAGMALLNTNGFTAARLMEAARLWRDPAKTKFAVNAIEGLTRFEDGYSAVTPELPDIGTAPLLPDYLAYADAELQEYLAIGRTVSFDNGLRRLFRALDRFSTDMPGVYRLGPPVSPWSVQDTDVPELADNTYESCTAQIIRLCYEYGKLLGNTSDGRKLQSIANQTMRRFSVISSNPFSPMAASYFASSLMVTDDRCAIAVGPKAQQLSDELFAKVPTRLIAPAFYFIRPDLQKKAPGIYVLSKAAIEGPFTVDQAATALSATYEVNG